MSQWAYPSLTLVIVICFDFSSSFSPFLMEFTVIKKMKCMMNGWGLLLIYANSTQDLLDEILGEGLFFSLL